MIFDEFDQVVGDDIEVYVVGDGEGQWYYDDGQEGRQVFGQVVLVDLFDVFYYQGVYQNQCGCGGGGGNGGGEWLQQYGEEEQYVYCYGGQVGVFFFFDVVCGFDIGGGGVCVYEGVEYSGEVVYCKEVLGVWYVVVFVEEICFLGEVGQSVGGVEKVYEEEGEDYVQQVQVQCFVDVELVDEVYWLYWCFEDVEQ